MAHLGNRLPTGPGSRGGQDRNEYQRRWRREHPEYRQRENERRKRQRQETRDRRPPPPTITDAVLEIVMEESARTGSISEVSREIAVDHATVLRWLDGREMTGDSVNAVVGVYGFDRLVVTMRRLRKIARGPVAVATRLTPTAARRGRSLIG